MLPARSDPAKQGLTHKPSVSIVPGMNFAFFVFLGLQRKQFVGNGSSISLWLELKIKNTGFGYCYRFHENMECIGKDLVLKKKSSVPSNYLYLILNIRLFELTTFNFSFAVSNVDIL